MLAEVLLQKKMTVIWEMTVLFRKNGQCDLSVNIKNTPCVKWVHLTMAVFLSCAAVGLIQDSARIISGFDFVPAF